MSKAVLRPTRCYAASRMWGPSSNTPGSCDLLQLRYAQMVGQEKQHSLHTKHISEAPLLACHTDSG